VVQFSQAQTPPTCGFEAYPPTTDVNDTSPEGNVVGNFGKSTGEFYKAVFTNATHGDYFDIKILDNHLIVQTKSGFWTLLDDDRLPTIVPAVAVQCKPDDVLDCVAPVWTINIVDTNSRPPVFHSSSPVTIEVDLNGYNGSVINHNKNQSINLIDGDYGQQFATLPELTADPVVVNVGNGIQSADRPWTTPILLTLVDDPPVGNHSITLEARDKDNQTATMTVNVRVFRSGGDKITGTFITVTLLSLIASWIRT